MALPVSYRGTLQCHTTAVQCRTTADLTAELLGAAGISTFQHYLLQCILVSEQQCLPFRVGQISGRLGLSVDHETEIVGIKRVIDSEEPNT